MKLKGAILLIGSLLWDPNQGDRIGLRKNWRNKRLLMKEKIHVKAPIRYGRLSGRNNERNYTIVFSKKCESKNRFGTAYVIPFKNKEICSLKGIENQARFLSEAEGASDRDLCKGGDKKWCTIGIIFNPHFDKNLQFSILDWWKELIEKDHGLIDYPEYKIGKEKSILSEKGQILIKWPKAIDQINQEKIDELDFILATCTKPNLKEYPCIEQLKENVQIDQRRYFFHNIENGITTFEDRLILKE